MKRMNKKPNFIGKHKNGFFRTGLVLTGLVVFLVLLGMVWSPYDPTAMSGAEKLQGISFRHVMGTDNMGRDVFSRVLYGSRVTLLIAAGTIFIGSLVGTLIGALTGYFGGLADDVLMRIMDALFAFPSILLALENRVLKAPSFSPVISLISS